MRNIHVIPTDKPSRLYKSKITQDVFISDNMFQHGDATYNVKYKYEIFLGQAKEMHQKEIMYAYMKTLPIEDGVFTAIDKAHEYYNEIYGGNNEQR